VLDRAAAVPPDRVLVGEDLNDAGPEHRRGRRDMNLKVDPRNKQLVAGGPIVAAAGYALAAFA
jgi:hypothetical protein